MKEAYFEGESGTGNISSFVTMLILVFCVGAWLCASVCPFLSIYLVIIIICFLSLGSRPRLHEEKKKKRKPSHHTNLLTYLGIRGTSFISSDRIPNYTYFSINFSSI
ncbi:uncharacterized protein F4822DRAFT_388149, partial [Hypoxylon trugodes]|uniref:uncharacterized protein n=1 Tax=Hypoxylon trugodes TaxID=326681 RepID=UPI00218F1ACE